ncbi:MAG: acetate/propionate family kinase [Acidimicrobiia bacterium]
MRILTVNAGSTSLKVRDVLDGATGPSHPSLAAALDGPRPEVVAHRVVHGGDRTGPARVDDAVLAELRALAELAPLHQPGALDALDRCREAWPEVPQVACFDTAFHTTVPEAARTYALSAHLRATVRSYGFHGLSHAWVVERVRAVAPAARRVVVAHLGGGQSLCAALDGRSVATTMGFTPLDGLVMATRPGSLDPGAVAWLARHAGEDLDDLLEHRSGLRGLCGDADMRAVQARRARGDADATLAFDVWRHRAVALLGGCVATLGGLDALAFTGGIGENDAEARVALAGALGWLGVEVRDPGRAAGDGVTDLTAPGARVGTFVVESREDLRMAAEATALLA